MDVNSWFHNDPGKRKALTTLKMAREPTYSYKFQRQKEKLRHLPCLWGGTISGESNSE